MEVEIVSFDWQKNYVNGAKNGNLMLIQINEFMVISQKTKIFQGVGNGWYYRKQMVIKLLLKFNKFSKKPFKDVSRVYYETKKNTWISHTEILEIFMHKRFLKIILFSIYVLLKLYTA